MAWPAQQGDMARRGCGPYPPEQELRQGVHQQQVCVGHPCRASKIQGIQVSKEPSNVPPKKEKVLDVGKVQRTRVLFVFVSYCCCNKLLQTQRLKILSSFAGRKSETDLTGLRPT